METIGDLLDAIRQVRKLETDSALAAALGVSRQTVNNWRQGRNTPDAVACATIAGLSGEPLAKVIGIAGEQRAISREEKAVWRKLAATAALLAVVVFPALTEHAQAATNEPKTAQSRHYAKWLIGLAWHWLAQRLRKPKPSPGNLEASICA